MYVCMHVCIYIYIYIVCSQDHVLRGNAEMSSKGALVQPAKSHVCYDESCHHKILFRVLNVI